MPGFPSLATRTAWLAGNDKKGCHAALRRLVGDDKWRGGGESARFVGNDSARV
jgi:hypothetical protein